MAERGREVHEGEVIDQGEIGGGGGLATIEAATRGEIDIQIATARRFPRDIKAFKREATDMVTLDADTAESCTYAIPRDGKTIIGPSARFAELIASSWGHLRAGSMNSGEDNGFVYTRGFAWDIQKNVAIQFEVKRRITNKYGNRYNDDMIAVASAAAGSIALRNAILKVVPPAYWKPIWAEARKTAAGDQKTLSVRRDAAIKYGMQMGLTQERILAAIGIGSVEQIDGDKLVELKALFVSVKDEGRDIDSIFPEVQSADQKGDLTDRLKTKAKPEPAPKPESKPEPEKPQEPAPKQEAPKVEAGPETQPEQAQEPATAEDEVKRKPVVRRTRQG